MLRSFLEQPLIHKTEMEERLDAVEAFCNNPLARDELREYLNPIYDLERLLGKVSYKTANPQGFDRFPQFHGNAASYQNRIKGAAR